MRHDANRRAHGPKCGVESAADTIRRFLPGNPSDLPARSLHHPPRPSHDPTVTSNRPEDVTQILAAAREGDEGALGHLLSAVQGELRQLAQRHLRRERRDHTLQPTALVNEAYLKLIHHQDQTYEDRGHFMAVASTAMRHVLLEHARARLADKRGGGAARVTLFEVPSVLEEEPEALVALDEALTEFAALDERNARIVELRWFGGLTNQEIAALLDVSTKTVERGWRVSQAWLKLRLQP